jgi:hypothetical protein
LPAPDEADALGEVTTPMDVPKLPLKKAAISMATAMITPMPTLAALFIGRQARAGLRDGRVNGAFSLNAVFAGQYMVAIPSADHPRTTAPART